MPVLSLSKGTPMNADNSKRKTFKAMGAKGTESRKVFLMTEFEVYLCGFATLRRRFAF
jgi:hypothetical protein